MRMKARIIIYVLYHERLHSCTDWRADGPRRLFPAVPGRAPCRFPVTPGKSPRRFPVTPDKSPRRSQFRANPKISRFCKKSFCANPHFCPFARKLVRNLHFSSCKFSIWSFLQEELLASPSGTPATPRRQTASGIRPPRAGRAPRHFPTMPSTPASPRRQASPRRKSDQDAPVPSSHLEAPPPRSTQSAAAPQK